MAKVKVKPVITETEPIWGYIKGECKWAKVLEVGQFGSYTIDIYGDEIEAHKEMFEELRDEAAKEVEDAGKKYTLADVVKTDDDGKEYIQFKLSETNYKDELNKIKIYDVTGNIVEDWSKLIGNGSIVKVKYRAAPYYMNSTKVVGVSYRFYAVQVLKLEEYTQKEEGFTDESSKDSAPFDADGDTSSGSDF